MSEHEIKFGAVIPNHNYGRWVNKAILSVVNDPYPKKCIAVVDDGSTDNSWEVICKTLGLVIKREHTLLTGEIQGIPAFAYRYKKAGGPSRARNTAIKMLWHKADVFGFLDSDDEYLPGKIAKSIDRFNNDTGYVGAVYTDYYTLDESTGLKRIEYKEPFSRDRLVQECIVHSACMVTKKAIEAIGFYDEEMRTCEDYDMWMRISEGFCIFHIPEPLMLVRVGNHSSTATVKSEIWNQNWRRVMLKAQARMNHGR